MRLKKNIILKIFKKFAISNRIKRNLRNATRVQNFSFSNVQRIGCIVDLDLMSETDFLEDFIRWFRVRPENYIILGYREKFEQTHLNGTPIFTWKDINLFANIHHYHGNRLCEQEYDILINYFNSPKLPLLLLSSLVKAKIRIGFQGIDNIYNDLILNCTPQDKEIFVHEVKKIIQTIR